MGQIVINIKGTAHGDRTTLVSECFRVSQLMFWFRSTTLAGSVQSHRSCRYRWTSPSPDITHSQRSGEHRGAFGSWRIRYFPQELMEPKTELKESECWFFCFFVCDYWMTTNITLWWVLMFSVFCCKKKRQLFAKVAIITPLKVTFHTFHTFQYICFITLRPYLKLHGEPLNKRT